MKCKKCGHIHSDLVACFLKHFIKHAKECPDCKGTGDLNKNVHPRIWDKCPRCDGEGYLEVTKK